jgi:hypothetical protein
VTRPPSVPCNWTQNEVADLEERAELAEKRLAELEAENKRLRKRLEIADKYREAIDNELILTRLGVAKDKPRDELLQIIYWHVDAAN